ncbi:DUF5134 domain-containing protein [Nocardia sp. NPDC004654]|uniref:DUF5134 domain-containing protein n=1 Tax=Nocardia sp. NPDC004654 TaxID=3154776 RepID=UPI0033B6B83F
MEDYFAAHETARWILVGLLVAGTAWTTLRLLVIRGVDVAETPGAYAVNRESDAAHLAMSTAMLLMLTTSVAHSLWTAVFLVFAVACIGPLTVHLIRCRRTGPTRNIDGIAASGYHLVAAAAMAYSTLGHRGHGAHHMEGTAAQSLPIPFIGYLMTALFALDALVVVVLATTMPAPATRNPLHSHRIGVFPHFAMDVAMASMLAAALLG